jgi:hypothetical protein
LISELGVDPAPFAAWMVDRPDSYLLADAQV